MAAHDRIELEAAEALAGLACFPTSKSVSNGGESVKDDSNDCISSFYSFPKSSDNSHQETTNSMVKGSKKSGILTSKSVKDEQRIKLKLNPFNHTNCASSGRKSRQNLTEAEIEARKIRRVLANRESARQTIRRRQAVFEELTRKAVDLAWENENLKREKDTASKHYDTLKTKNQCLKAKMSKLINNETEETREESITVNEPAVSTSSTTSPFVIYNQPSFLPFLWPGSVQLQCGSPAGIVFPSRSPITAAGANTLDSSSCEVSSMTINASGTPLYLFPYPWVVTIPQNYNDSRPHSFNLNDKPREASECQQFFPEKGVTSTCFSSDGGGPLTTHSVSCEELLIEHDDTTDNFLKHLKAGDSIHKVPVLCSGKRLGDTGAATEARKRRKQLTRLKNPFHCRPLRMH